MGAKQSTNMKNGVDALRTTLSQGRQIQLPNEEGTTLEVHPPLALIGLEQQLIFEIIFDLKDPYVADEESEQHSEIEFEKIADTLEKHFSNPTFVKGLIGTFSSEEDKQGTAEVHGVPKLPHGIDIRLSNKSSIEVTRYMYPHDVCLASYNISVPLVLSSLEDEEEEEEEERVIAVPIEDVALNIAAHAEESTDGGLGTMLGLDFEAVQYTLTNNRMRFIGPIQQQKKQKMTKKK